MKFHQTLFICLAMSLMHAHGLHANDTLKSHTLTMNQWLILPGHAVPLPLFHDVGDVDGKTFSNTQLLNAPLYWFHDHSPAEGVVAGGGVDRTWRAVALDEDGVIPLGRGAIDPQVVYLATWVRADRWLRVRFELTTPVPAKGWLGEEALGTKSAFDEGDKKPGSLKKSVTLVRGNHLLLIKCVIPAGMEAMPTLHATLEWDTLYGGGAVTLSRRPTDRKNIHHLLDGVKVTSVVPSADGEYYLVSYREAVSGTDRSESWSEIRRTADRKLIHSYRHSAVSQVRWLPNTNRVSYVTSQQGKSTLHLYDLIKGEVQTLLTEVEKMGSYRWAPDETFVLFSVREEPSDKPGVMRHLQGMPDRQPGWRNRSHLHRYDIAAGTTTRLTWGNLTTHLHDISPDSRKIAFSQHYPDFTERPYSKQNLFVMDLTTRSLDTILSDNPWSVTVSFSPDGKYLLTIGGPETFGSAGLNLSEELIPHNSDLQVYLYELATGNVRSITRDFNPSVSSVHWHPTDNHIYMVVVEEDFRYLYRYDLRKEQFSRIETGHDYISTANFASRALTATFGANNTNSYPCWYTLDLRRNKTAPLECTEVENYRHVTFGDVKQWDFTASTGVEIKGRVYYPPGFDPEKKYPVIVYYYGGITPVGRTFGGRYPFNLWAGNDYLVYVLQPSGAIGFGQEFSAAHVNNWGYTVADEIIEGTKKFLDAHPFANRERVGCAGASYGGFMTMLLLTRTDIFAAAISHAGISSISSYWGEGFWGYAYSAGASAFSFPWNNKELYIGQSPLFHADKINTPLLLLTGDEDTNVPPGESIQMYTALKLLGRPVELIFVEGEDHTIITYTKRVLWHNAIMAWWDRHLKGQPEWWKEQYGVTINGSF
jgi:dipeptidyl aminopeptidase/acylaminoacyl peptidase